MLVSCFSWHWKYSWLRESVSTRPVDFNREHFILFILTERDISDVTVSLELVYSSFHKPGTQFVERKPSVDLNSSTQSEVLSTCSMGRAL